MLPRQTSKGGPCLSNSSFLIFSPRRRWQVKGPLLLTVSLSIVQQLEMGGFSVGCWAPVLKLLLSWLLVYCEFSALKQHWASTLSSPSRHPSWCSSPNSELSSCPDKDQLCYVIARYLSSLIIWNRMAISSFLFFFEKHLYHLMLPPKKKYTNIPSFGLLFGHCTSLCLLMIFFSFFSFFFLVYYIGV